MCMHVFIVVFVILLAMKSKRFHNWSNIDIWFGLPVFAISISQSHVLTRSILYFSHSFLHLIEWWTEAINVWRMDLILKPFWAQYQSHYLLCSHPKLTRNVRKVKINFSAKISDVHKSWGPRTGFQALLRYRTHNQNNQFYLTRAHLKPQHTNTNTFTLHRWIYEAMNIYDEQWRQKPIFTHDSI